MTERGAGVVESVARACALAALVLGAGCTDSHGNGATGPKGSTETGNPPVLDAGGLSLVVSENAVHVVGEPGAVMPPEGTVEITVVRTGEKITGMVNADGSFDVQVDGTLDDVFEVRVLHEGQSSMVITVSRGGAMVGGSGDAGMMPEPNGMQCAELDMRVVNGAMMVAASSQTACMSDDDCTIVRFPIGCGSSSCDFRYVARASASGTEAALAQIQEMTCANFEALGCMPAPACVADPVEPACIGGRCAPRGSKDPCADCEDFEISWRAVDPGILPAEVDPSVHEITGCGTLKTTSYDERTCESELPVCAMGATWKGQIDALLAEDEVAAAIAMGGTYGEDPEYGGFQWEISVRGSTFRYRDCAGLPNRPCEPSKLKLLVVYLNELLSANRCQLPDCDSPFEPGAETMPFGVYWHDPASRTCLWRGYSGVGGNDNRYATLEECQRACAPPAGPGDCGEGRAFIENQCLACGLAGGCENESPRCLLTCDSDAECEGEERGGADFGAPACLDQHCRHPLYCE